MWHDMGSAFAAEFSDLPNAAIAVHMLVRLLVAAGLGGLLGYEREMHGKPAGTRTHMLVALGAALFVLVPQQAGLANADLSRVLQGIVAGIGFLGAGTIVKTQSSENVHGMTTAAGIWLTAAIGIAVGMGRQGTAIVSTMLALAILRLHHHLTRDQVGEPETHERR